MAGHLREAGKGALLTVLSRAQDWDMRHRLQAGETRGLLRYQQMQAWLGNTDDFFPEGEVVRG